MQWLDLVGLDGDNPPEETDVATKSDTRRLSGIDKFMRMLETRMLQGRTLGDCRKWATDLGIPEEAFLKMFGVIKQSWRSPQLTYDLFCERRDLARARYLDIYVRASEDDNYMVMLRAIEGIIKLDGLEAPTTLQLNIQDPGQGITNSARDQVAQLVEKMKQLAETRKLAVAVTEEVIETTRVLDVNEDGEIEGSYPGAKVGPIIQYDENGRIKKKKNGSNGSNGSNGHH